MTKVKSFITLVRGGKLKFVVIYNGIFTLENFGTWEITAVFLNIDTWWSKLSSKFKSVAV